ncbi:galactan 1,3-beta-galactosidase [Pterulicium gracile]|uniref:Galactan 1,3-beta-galactosidase n=1 Tax=Pterulicium gracile TaxID=1884261 RepID=A0A5C3Q6A0_9AGAR|nr:galactan 1,3-beta-galactosidase [Pterula gracilis]
MAFLGSLLALLTSTSLLGGAVQAASVIVPGAAWTDTSGNVIQAHGAGILKVGSTFYMHGEDKTHNSGLFRAVTCYSSSDLVNWSRQNDALTPIANTPISTANIVERPKVIFNQRNSEYVMWFHSDSSNYGAAQVGVATAKSPCGPYSYKASWRPLGAESRDMGLFQDDDSVQTAYVLYASDNNQNFKITRLDANYYNVTTQVAVIPSSTIESPGIYKRNGVYWLFGSMTTGWNPNPNKYWRSNALSGTWSSSSDIAPQATRTYFSQHTYTLPLGSNGVYMGDRWRPQQLGGSRYIWLPMSYSSGSPQLVWADVWSINVGAGTYTVHTGTTYEAENGSRGGASTLMDNSGFSGGRGIGYLGNGGTVTINNVQGLGRDQWVSLYYAVGDSTWRNVTVSVNGGGNVLVDQPNTGSGNTILSVPVKLNLRNGANTLVFGGGQSNYAGDLDKIIVYTQA